MATVVAWLRNDLRLDDNPALYHAFSSGNPVAVVYVWSPGELGKEAPGGAAKWWLENALTDLDFQLRRRGSRLILLKGHAADSLRTLADACKAKEIHWNRRYSPAAAALDEAVRRKLTASGYDVRVHAASCLREPDEVLHGGQPYRVFTPYYKAAEKIPVRAPVPALPETLPGPAHLPHGVPIESLGLTPGTGWVTGLARAWVPTKAGLDAALQKLKNILSDYSEDRDIPFMDATSRLSPYLHFGQVSVVRLLEIVRNCGPGPGGAAFERELHWREFARHTLFHFPKLADEPLDESFRKMVWLEDKTRIEAWKKGLTGYPIVDAGMRQLWKTGWMHNRVRMIAGSFLVKDLLADWRIGESWFADTLVDADPANNALGWQWVAGCGPDAAPYFRVFNPVLQGRKFDPDGFYIRRYVPELAYLPEKWIHSPWTAPKSVLKEAGITLGVDYPMPVVDHADARKRALAAYQEARSRKGGESR